MARFFIDRPIFAWVIAIVIMLAGALAIGRLPVSRFPDIAPPVVTIDAFYPGASAKVVENSVTQIIEQNMKALDGLLFMTSTSDATGRAGIVLTFNNSVNADIAQVQVQNKLQVAMPFLPQDVQQQGINVAKASSNFALSVALVSDGAPRNEIEDYVATNIADVIARVPGVGATQVFASKYAMRIWLDPDKLDAYKLTPTDVVAALRAQNQQVAVGQLGGTPAIKGQQINATINARGRLQTPEQFRAIVLRGNTAGSVLKLGDVARVEMGTEEYGFISRINGKPATGLGVMLAAGANALETAAAVKATVERIKPTLPRGMTAIIPFDTTPFISAAIKGVVVTLIEAVALVFVVMYLFLQNFRATLIPTITVPVVLLGTFVVLQAFGFSINMLTMFAMVLAIGLVVDDAIVVVENVERVMSEEGLPPLEATRKSMDQITGALIAIGVVLAAVFLPMAFIGGATGVIYRQFSATIVSAIVFSVLMAIVLTPALCATLLKPIEKGHHYHDTGFFGWFNQAFDRSNARYQGSVRKILSRQKRFGAAFLVMAGLAGLIYFRLPTAFLPEEDQGWLIGMVQTPVGATLERTSKVVDQMEEYFLNDEKDSMYLLWTVEGFSFIGNGQNAAASFMTLKDWSERDDPAKSVHAVAARAMAKFSQIKDGFIFAFPPPAAPDLGNASGYSFFLTDNNDAGHDALLQARNQLLAMAAENKLLASVRPAGMEDTPQMRIDIDNQQATAFGLKAEEINEALAIAWGGRYVDDFIDRGRVKHVYVQADAPFRMVPEDFKRWSVRNANGDMVPFSAFASWHWDYGSPRLERFNGVPALQIDGASSPGVSTGTAMAEVEKLVAQLPEGFGLEWTGISFVERAAGSQTTLVYALSIVFVFLCLAALYESWTIPTAVLMIAPLGILGAVLAPFLREMNRDVYFQVGMLTTIGLSCKNAILIVEFAKLNMEQGMSLIDATMNAIRDRLRPIIMTSLAFGLGVLPLAIAGGAGSGAQQAIGTGVLGGMLTGTFLGIFFVPLFFVVVKRVFAGRTRSQPAAEYLPATEGGFDK
ncbi:MAG TPA: efflux RND transporter permease subunit [Steroidobacteraceae bacterium]|nr:efflux RND transporter permease subunit [Steroidobacteraceae bacterium]